MLLVTFLKRPVWLETLAVIGTALMLFSILSSLFVSGYAYDRAGVTRWEWMRSSLQTRPSKWTNIHAGLDESTASLRRLLPGTDGVVVDLYDPATMTEPSIARARRMYPAMEPFQVGRAEALPLLDRELDAVSLSRRTNCATWRNARCCFVRSIAFSRRMA